MPAAVCGARVRAKAQVIRPNSDQGRRNGKTNPLPDPLACIVGGGFCEGMPQGAGSMLVADADPSPPRGRTCVLVGRSLWAACGQLPQTRNPAIRSKLLPSRTAEAAATFSTISRASSSLPRRSLDRRSENTPTLLGACPPAHLGRHSQAPAADVGQHLASVGQEAGLKILATSGCHTLSTPND